MTHGKQRLFTASTGVMNICRPEVPDIFSNRDSRSFAAKIPTTILMGRGEHGRLGGTCNIS